MNDERRERIRAVLAQVAAIERDEQEALDSMPDGFQEGPTGERIQLSLAHLAAARASLRAALDPTVPEPPPVPKTLPVYRI